MIKINHIFVTLCLCILNAYPTRRVSNLRHFFVLFSCPFCLGWNQHLNWRQKWSELICFSIKPIFVLCVCMNSEWFCLFICLCQFLRFTESQWFFFLKKVYQERERTKNNTTWIGLCVSVTDEKTTISIYSYCLYAVWLICYHTVEYWTVSVTMYENCTYEK